MEEETIRDIEGKAAQVKRRVVEPWAVKYACTVVGVLVGIAAAVWLYFTVARDTDSFYLTLGCAAGGGFLGYGTASGLLYLREVIHNLRK